METNGSRKTRLLKVIVVAGAPRSGKSRTLGRKRDEGFKAKLKHEWGMTIFSHNGKRVAVYSGSCQEVNPFCEFRQVIECIENRLGIAESRGCHITVMPFTLWVNGEGKLNELCITKPLDWMQQKGVEAHLVHLSKESANGFKRMEELMQRLGAETIVSDNHYRRQVAEFWRIFLRIDP